MGVFSIENVFSELTQNLYFTIDHALDKERNSKNNSS
jgi:hypothetical protein